MLLYIISDIQVRMLGIFNHVESMKTILKFIGVWSGNQRSVLSADCSKKNTKSVLPVEFFTNDTRFVKDFSVLLNRTTARDWWNRRMLGTETVPNLAFKLKMSCTFNVNKQFSIDININKWKRKLINENRN